MPEENKNTLENYLQNKPVSDRNERLMEEGGDDIEFAADEPEEEESEGKSKFPTDDDREHIRRLSTEPGWRVLLKLLDIEIAKLEDSARAASLSAPFAHEENGHRWADVSYMKRTQDRLKSIIEREKRKLKKNVAKLDG